MIEEEEVPEGEDGFISQQEGEFDSEGEEEEEETDQIPLLFVDVNLGEGISDRIVLYDGDEPEELAQEFAQRHNLDDGMQSKLTELLNQQMNGVLKKIVEDPEDDEHAHEEEDEEEL